MDGGSDRFEARVDMRVLAAVLDGSILSPSDRWSITRDAVDRRLGARHRHPRLRPRQRPGRLAEPLWREQEVPSLTPTSTGYDGRLAFTPFIMGQGIAFEAAIATHLATLAR